MKESIDIPIACIKCRKYGDYATECGKGEKAKKKQDGVDTKLVTLQDLMTKAKIVKQEIKEDNSTDINEHNIAEIINLKEHSKSMTDPPSLVEEDILDKDNNQQNILSLINRVIFQKWHTEIT